MSGACGQDFEICGCVKTTQRAHTSTQHRRLPTCITPRQRSDLSLETSNHPQQLVPRAPVSTDRMVKVSELLDLLSKRSKYIVDDQAASISPNYLFSACSFSVPEPELRTRPTPTRMPGKLLSSSKMRKSC